MHEHAGANAGFFTRLRDMMAGWGCVGLIYWLSGAWQGKGVVLPETALDRLIAFNPAGLWLYLSFFAFIPYTFLMVDTPKLRWLRMSMQACALLCGAVFLLWPTTLAYPDYAAHPAAAGAGPGASLLRLLLWGDSPQNCLPSLHAALTLLCAWALLDAKRPLRSTFAIIAALCICFSVIQLRRHLSLDVAAGLAAGVVSGALCRLVPHRRDRAVPARKFLT
ncbi:phosphatase PAP2 family protein [Polaromonas sp. YR568]|uniref:phosphatase PAP2 family protein n=1 Tax=Polaromonas sp. YR568 TaxID=1855301 RepID=UPI00398BEE4F